MQVGGGGVGEHRVRPQALQGGQILDGPGVRRGGEAEPGPGRGSAHGLDAGAVQRHGQVQAPQPGPARALGAGLGHGEDERKRRQAGAGRRRHGGDAPWTTAPEAPGRRAPWTRCGRAWAVQECPTTEARCSRGPPRPLRSRRAARRTGRRRVVSATPPGGTGERPERRWRGNGPAGPGWEVGRGEGQWASSRGAARRRPPRPESRPATAPSAPGGHGWHSC